MALQFDDIRSNASDDQSSTISEESFDPEDSIMLDLPDSVLEKIDLQPLKNLTEHEYSAGRAVRSGKANPEIMDVPFWSAMMAAQEDPYGAYCLLQRSDNLPNHNGVDDFLEPMRAEETEHLAEEDREQVTRSCYRRLPTWTFAKRMGQTMTRLPDGRRVFIGGEYDDFYDPDFHIYNDVCVYNDDDDDSKSGGGSGGGNFVVYGYPRDVFPPTDFHTATLVPRTSDIYVIGGLGYADRRRPGETPVYRLDTRDFSMHAVPTSGEEKPGWIRRHRACLVEDGTAIRVWGKKRRYFGSEVYLEGGETEKKGGGDFVDFEGEYLLHLETGQWTKLA